MTAPDILTERLCLRQARADDADWIAREISAPDVHKWLSAPPKPYRLKDAQGFVERQMDNPEYRVICQDGEAMGVISISRADPDKPDLGYWLRQSAWGGGVMPEAARGFLDWYATYDHNPIYSGWMEGNGRSASVLKNLGFKSADDVHLYSHYWGKDVLVKKVRIDKWGPMFTCATDRLILDGLVDADLPTLHREWGDPGVARMVATVLQNWTLDEARIWLTRRRPQSADDFSCAVRLPDGTLIGSVGFGGDPRNLGFMFGRAHWGQEFATEAVGMFVATVLPNSRTSTRLRRKCLTIIRGQLGF